jgi:predicted PurR-regulated permease PerM
MRFGRSSDPRQIELTIPARTYFIFFAIVALIAVTYFLFPMILLVYLSLLIAITLTKLERFLMCHGWRKLYADIFLIICLLVILSVILFVLIPTAVTQMEEIANHRVRN